MSAGFYDSDEAVSQYLLFHYGTPEQICPLLPEARGACGFPVRCVTEPLRHVDLRRHGRALDLGCAVGRSSLELGRFFDEVVGIDFSARFVEMAERMRVMREILINVPREGVEMDEMKLTFPLELATNTVRFEQGDACNLRADIGRFDFALLANLIDRLPDPTRCLERMADMLSPGGWLAISSPYTWLDDYTPRDKWLGQADGTLAALRRVLTPAFECGPVFDLPFLIREHRRKYQWSVAEVSLWQRR